MSLLSSPSQVACVVDTDVISFLFKGASQARLYLPHMQNRLLFISFMTLAELNRWALAKNWGARSIGQLEKFLEQFHLYPFDKQLCRLWAEVIVGEQRKGRVISMSDAWVASTALATGLPLITHNRRHFEGIAGLTVISES